MISPPPAGAVIDPAWADAFARAWIAAWNAHDLEAVFALFDDNFTMRSPLIAQRGFSPDGVLRGKDAVRPYWSAGLASAVPPIAFELIGVHAGVGVVAILYRSIGRGKLVIERIEIGADGRGTACEGLYRDDPEAAGPA